MWKPAISFVCVVAALFAFSPPARACGNYFDLDELSIEAAEPDARTATRAIAELRAAGPRGLAALMRVHGDAIARHRAHPAEADSRWGQVAAALDAVAGQKDAWASGLYWYTDLEQAKAAAARQNRPILSLRLLGTLDSEFSCANSRFFRTVLYANREVGRYLVNHFVLHWQSHCPVPKLTIDYGDGRVIQRTITGNSAHYVLTPDGRVVDVLPGLYGPKAFMTGLARARVVAMAHADAGFEATLRAYHEAQLARVREQWARDLARVHPDGGRALGIDLRAARQPTAAEAARIAVSKSAVELRPVLAIAPERLAAATDDAMWQAIAALHAEESRLDEGSRAVVTSKGLPAAAANDRTRSKRQVEDPLMRMIQNLERTVAQDTVRNEYLLHARVHEWFATGTAPRSLDELNQRVYAELFLMPASDPWLGLVPPDTYTALPREATAAK